MFKAFKYRIYPTDSQKELIEKHIGCSRLVYNLALETKIYAYKSAGINLTSFELSRQLPGLKNEFSWLKEVNAQSLTESIRNLDAAYKMFFKSVNSFPKFKSKKTNGSFCAPQYVRIEGDKLILIKFKEGIKINIHRPLKGKIKQCTISKTPTGKYFASLLCDTGEVLPLKLEINSLTTVGIDLGIKSFAVTSGGEVIENSRFYKKSLAKLKYIDKKFSKHKGKRTQQRRALIHEKVANQRTDFLHKTSIKFIRENQTIAIEDLSVENMAKNHNLAQAIRDVGWGEFVRQLKYKSEWYGNNLLQIGRFEPSSKTCSCCGIVNKGLTLDNRDWTCICGAVLDRDENAALNIKYFALKNILSGTDRKNQDELPTSVGVMTPEALTG